VPRCMIFTCSVFFFFLGAILISDSNRLHASYPDQLIVCGVQLYDNITMASKFVIERTEAIR